MWVFDEDRPWAAGQRCNRDPHRNQTWKRKTRGEAGAVVALNVETTYPPLLRGPFPTGLAHVTCRLCRRSPVAAASDSCQTHKLRFSLLLCRCPRIHIVFCPYNSCRANAPTARGRTPQSPCHTRRPVTGLQSTQHPHVRRTGTVICSIAVTM